MFIVRYKVCEFGVVYFSIYPFRKMTNQWLRSTLMWICRFCPEMRTPAEPHDLRVGQGGPGRSRRRSMDRSLQMSRRQNRSRVRPTSPRRVSLHRMFSNEEENFDWANTKDRIRLINPHGVQENGSKNNISRPSKREKKMSRSRSKRRRNESPNVHNGSDDRMKIIRDLIVIVGHSITAEFAGFILVYFISLTREFFNIMIILVKEFVIY